MQNFELHPLDAQILRGEPFYNPRPKFYKAQYHNFQCKLAVDVEVYLNFIALDLVNQLGLKVEPHLRPHYLEDEFVEYQCNISFKIGQYEDILSRLMPSAGTQCSLLNLLYSNVLGEV